jgi:hypothetical protein
MKTNKIIISTAMVGVLLATSITSCKKDFFDVNTNPNDPADVGVNYLLPSAQAAIGYVVGKDLQLFGNFYAQHWTQNPSSSQYKTIEQYNPSADDFDRPWKSLYADGLQDLKAILTKANADQTNYSAIANILQAYTFQLLTDYWGDVPYSQALQDGNVSPGYDSQEAIYDGIIAQVKTGLSQIDENALVIPGSDDLIFGGDMSMWRKFGNTLLLRMYIRISLKDPTTAQNGIGELAAAGAEFLAEGETAQLNYINSGGNTNPLYSELSGYGFTQNMVASATAIDFLNNNNDPRVDAFYVPASNGLQVGIPQGLYDTTANIPISEPGIITGGNSNFEESAAAPVIFLSSWESLFLQAEATARGWMTTGGTDQELYERAITENFFYLGMADTAAATYYTQAAIAYPSGGTLDEKIEAIITQKWISMCGVQGGEAWTEWRRTGYPDFFVYSANSLIGNQFPQRLFYPSTEVTQNASFPGQKAITDKMWWDVN